MFIDKPEQVINVEIRQDQFSIRLGMYARRASFCAYLTAFCDIWLVQSEPNFDRNST